MTYEVIVGNIGTVHIGNNIHKANSFYSDYVEQSKNLVGSRAYGETVTMMKDGEILYEHQGHLELD